MITLHRCSWLVKSRRTRWVALSFAILIGLFLPNIPSIPVLGLGRVFASVRELLSRPKTAHSNPKPAQMMGELHIVHIPYFINSDGMTSILTLNNNHDRRGNRNGDPLQHERPAVGSTGS